MPQKAWFADHRRLKYWKAAFHEYWSMSMVTLILRPSHPRPRVHQKNWGAVLLRGWRRYCLRWERHSQRKVLRDLADNPHLLKDIGVSRDEALREAERQVWNITDIYVHSV